MQHDQLFKELLQSFLPEFLDLFFPEKARQIDWATLEFANSELFTSGSQGARRTVDLVAKVRSLTGDPEELLLHVEIEAAPKAEFAARMFEYYMLLRLRDGLPVLPIAILLQPGFGGVSRGEHEERVLGEEIVRFHFLRVALRDLRYGSLPLANPVAPALSPLLAGAPDDPVELLLESLEGIAETESDLDRRMRLAAFMSGYVKLAPEQTRLLLDQELHAAPEVRTMTTIWHEIGRDEGRLEGRLEGPLESILRYLGAKFGSVPEELEAELRQIDDVDILDRLISESANSPSLEAFIAALAHTLPG